MIAGQRLRDRPAGSLPPALLLSAGTLRASHVGGLVGDLQLAAGEADVERAADLAVGLGDDVLRVGVGTDQAGDLYIEAGLLLDLANGRARQGVDEVHTASGRGHGTRNTILLACSGLVAGS